MRQQQSLCGFRGDWLLRQRPGTEAEFDFQLVGDMPVKGRERAIRVYQMRADMSAVSNPAH